MESRVYGKYEAASLDDLVKETLPRNNTNMSSTEMKEALVTLTLEERAELKEQLRALEEGVTVEELREIDAMLDEELNDPSPRHTLDDVRKNISMKIDDEP